MILPAFFAIIPGGHRFRYDERTNQIDVDNLAILSRCHIHSRNALDDAGRC